MLALLLCLLNHTSPASAACVSPNAPVGTLIYNKTDNVPQYCDDTNWIALAPLGGFDVDAVTFDGGDWLKRGANITGLADGKKFTVSFWFRTSTAGTWMRFLDTNPAGRFTIGLKNTNDINVFVVQPDGSNNINGDFGANLADGKWHHFLMSADVNTSTWHVYIDGVADTTTMYTISNTNLDFTPTDWGIGIQPQNDWNPFNGDMAEFWMDFDTYVDLTVKANRNKFISANGKPAFLGEDGNLPTGSRPDIYLSGLAADFPENNGSGGGFTVTGALADAATSPDDPLTAPVWLGSITNTTSLNGAVGVAVHGDYAYVAADDGDRLTVVNISDPAAPSIVGSVTDAQIDGAGRIFLRYPYAFVTSRFPDRLVAINVSNPASPSVAGSIQDTLRLDGAIDIEGRGRYAYVGAPNQDYITIVDIADPTSMSITGSLSSALYDFPIDLDVSGSYAYVVGETSDSLVVVDISNPASPSIAGSVTDAMLDRPVGVTVVYPYAYVSAHDLDRITVVDVSDPANPTVVGGVSDATNLNGPRLSAAAGDYLYVANVVSDSLAIVDISNPLAPVVLGDTGGPGATLDWGWNVALANGYGYIAARSGDSLAVMRINGCGDPEGVKGQMHYNTETHAPMYCDGDHWVTLNPNYPLGCPNIGDICSDGSVYAGLSPDGNANMYTTKCDGGQAWDGSACTGTRTSLAWGYDTTQTGFDSYTDGDGNTQGLTASPIASACAGAVDGGRSDWYLPARDELNVLWINRASIGNFDLSDSHWYWTSTEAGSDRAWKQRFSINGYQEWNTLKTDLYDYRCVRKGPRRGLLSDPSLVAHWPLDEWSGTVANDIAGDNIGFASNGVIFQSAGGQIAGAAEFDGVDTRVDIGPMNITSGEITMAAWVRADTFNVNDPRVIAKTNSSGDAAHFWAMYFGTAAGNANVLARLKASTITDTVASTGTVTPGVWTHIAVTYDPDLANEISFYINGTLDSSLSHSAGGALSSSTSMPVTIGNIWSGSGEQRPFDGLIDDIRVYDRALTAAEIAEIYAAGNLGLAAQDCTLPNGAEGTMLYNTDVNAIQYCDGVNWVKLGKR